MTTERMVNRGLYRTPDNSFIMFRWRKYGRGGKPFAELINIVTGDSWYMSMSKGRTQRYLSALKYTGAKVKCDLKPWHSYNGSVHSDYKRGVKS